MENIEKITTDLAVAQSQMDAATKNSKNPHFKSQYADLQSVMSACKAALNKNGIAIIYQTTRSPEGDMYGVTTLAHKSGQTLSCEIPLLLGRSDMQSLGSATTYARRYGLMALTGLAPEDDDGNEAAKNPAAKALGDAWRDGVLDGLPANASAKDKARAFTAQLVEDFKKPKTLKTLEGIWKKRENIIASIQRADAASFDDLIVAFETEKAKHGEPTIADEHAAGYAGG